MGEESERGQYRCPAARGLLSTHPASSHFIHFPYATGAPLAVALVMVPRGGGVVYVVGPHQSFKWTLLRDRQFLLPPQPPLVFTDRNYKALFSWCWNPELCSLAWGWHRSLPRCPPDFSPLHVNVGSRRCFHTVSSSPTPHPHPSYPTG